MCEQCYEDYETTIKQLSDLLLKVLGTSSPFIAQVATKAHLDACYEAVQLLQRVDPDGIATVQASLPLP